MSELSGGAGSRLGQVESDVEVEFVVFGEESLGVHFWADDSTENRLWADIRARTAPSGNPPTFGESYALKGPPEPAGIAATELLLGALGAGGAITMLVQILRDWVARYRIKVVSVRLPDGTNIHVTDASITSVERLFAAIGAHHPQEAVHTPIAPPDTPEVANAPGEPTPPE